MNSLRSRLVFGFALVAVVPLLVTTLVLSRRIQETVRGQAAGRLAAALQVIGSQVREDGERSLERLEILARDAELRRLALVQPVNGRDLPERLAEKRFLLGLDALDVTQPSGAPIADAADAPSALASDSEAVRLPIGGGAPTAGVEIQRLGDGAALAMVARAPILYQGQVAAVVRGAMLLDRRRLVRLARAGGIDLILRDASGTLVVSTLDGVADESLAAIRDGAVTISGRGSSLARTLALGPGAAASLTGFASTSTADRAIAALRQAAALFGLVGLAAAIALGLLWSHQVSAPVERLARFSERVARGEWDEPLALRSVHELETLALALDRMRADLGAQRERLAASERHAAWSVMARAVAHEVRNPLTPIAVSVADLRRSYEQGRPDFPQVLDQAVRIIGDEIESLRRMLNEFSELGRFPEPRFAACRIADVVDDLETLYAGDVAAGRIVFARPPADLAVCADRGQLRQALVNLVKNGLEAIAPGGRVGVEARATGTGAEISVADDGPGLDEEQRARLFEPRFTTKPHGSGLGLTIVHRIVNDHGGTIVVDSAAGRGTRFRMRLPRAEESDACRP